MAEDAAGTRVGCPHCAQTFLAPGVAPSVSNDDDWLQMDEPSLPSSNSGPPKPATTQPPPVAPASTNSGPKISPEDEAMLREFTTDLNEFTAEIESVPAPGPPASPPPTRSNPDNVGSTPAPLAPTPEFADQYRVKCKICGSLLYARATQAGRTVKCGDCHSPVTIPPPPRVSSNAAIDLDQAPTFGFEPSGVEDRRTDPFKKSADELLDEAARENREQPKTDYDDIPSFRDWFSSVFGIFGDLGVLAHWIGLSLLGTIPVFFLLSFEHPMLTMALFPLGFFLGVLTVSCAFAILQALANEEDTVTDWPSLDPFAWLGQLFLVVAAASVAAVPVWMLCVFTIGVNLTSVAFTMFVIYAVFPFVLLSMMDMNSVMIPFSPEVARSVNKCEESWGGFYFSSAVLFLALFLVFVMTGSMPPHVAAAISITLSIGAVFCYFSMIGRLAYSIGQAVNAPKMENDIDRSFPTDAR